MAGRFLLPILLVLASRLVAAPLDPLLADPGLWTMKPAEFESRGRPLGFRWVSQTKDSARVAGEGLTIFSLPVVEAVARFEAEKVKEVTVAIYARGDAGTITREAFDALIRNAEETLNRTTGVKFAARGKDPASAVKADGRIWAAPAAHYLLEYSATREIKSRDVPFRAEFVRLEITPPPKASSMLGAALQPMTRVRFSGPQHVKKDATSGDVLIPDVPMVDQGQKGYCVVASTERVMRYYGAQVDANELAQIANSDAEGGTSNTAMFAALKKVSARLKVRVKQLEDLNIKAILELVKDYNRVAKKTGVSPIADPGNEIDVALIYRQVEPATLKETRTHNRSDFGRFQREVQQSIDQGVPLLWSVQLGIVKEPGIPQNAGGHMRLIIGYNTKTSELIFSDSWGAGHEQKRMPMDDAWTITTGVASIEAT
jgi:hypothetical protein